MSQTSEALEAFAEAQRLEYAESVELPELGGTLSRSTRKVVGAATGQLPGGIEGTVAHFSYQYISNERTRTREMTIVVGRVPASVGDAPYLLCSGPESGTSIDVSEAREVDTGGDAAIGNFSCAAFAGTSEGWLRELFSPALVEWIGRSADDFAFELADGVLCVSRIGHLVDDADLLELCEDAAHVAELIGAESLEEARTGGARRTAAREITTGNRLVEKTLGRVPSDPPPPDVAALVPAFRRAIALTPRFWLGLLLISAGATLLLNLPAVAIPIILIQSGNWTLLWVVEGLALLIIAILWGRLIIGDVAGQCATEAFFRGYVRERGLTLEEPYDFAAAHAEAGLGFKPERVIVGFLPGGVEGALVLRGDGTKRNDRIALVGGPTEPVASAGLRAEAQGLSAAGLDAYAKRLTAKLARA